jgi:hypothetical protein
VCSPPPWGRMGQFLRTNHGKSCLQITGVYSYPLCKARHPLPGLSYLCARQGAITWGCKSPIDPAGGTVSRTARVSTARWDLKEAAGKALARRTETAYEAAILDERANRLKVRYLHGKYGSICSGYKREGDSVLPGEVCQPAMCYGHREVTGRVGRSQQRA